MLDGIADSLDAGALAFGDSGHVKPHEIIGVDPLGLFVRQSGNRRDPVSSARYGNMYGGGLSWFRHAPWPVS